MVQIYTTDHLPRLYPNASFTFDDILKYCVRINPNIYRLYEHEGHS